MKPEDDNLDDMILDIEEDDFDVDLDIKVDIEEEELISEKNIR